MAVEVKKGGRVDYVCEGCSEIIEKGTPHYRAGNSPSFKRYCAACNAKGITAESGTTAPAGTGKGKGKGNGNGKGRPAASKSKSKSKGNPAGKDVSTGKNSRVRTTKKPAAAVTAEGDTEPGTEDK